MIIFSKIIGYYQKRNQQDLMCFIELRDIYVGIFIIEISSIIRFIEINRHIAEVVTINSLIDIYSTMLARCVLPRSISGHIPNKDIIRRLKRTRNMSNDERIAELISIRELVAKEQDS